MGHSITLSSLGCKAFYKLILGVHKLSRFIKLELSPSYGQLLVSGMNDSKLSFIELVINERFWSDRTTAVISSPAFTSFLVDSKLFVSALKTVNIFAVEKLVIEFVGEDTVQPHLFLRFCISYQSLIEKKIPLVDSASWNRTGRPPILDVDVTAYPLQKPIMMFNRKSFEQILGFIGGSGASSSASAAPSTVAGAGKKRPIGLEFFVSPGICRFATVDLQNSMLSNTKTTTSEMQVKTQNIQFAKNQGSSITEINCLICPFAEVRLFAAMVPDDAQIFIFLGGKPGDFIKFSAIAMDMEIRLGLATADLAKGLTNEEPSTSFQHEDPSDDFYTQSQHPRNQPQHSQPVTPSFLQSPIFPTPLAIRNEPQQSSQPSPQQPPSQQPPQHPQQQPSQQPPHPFHVIPASVGHPTPAFNHSTPTQRGDAPISHLFVTQPQPLAPSQPQQPEMSPLNPIPVPNPEITDADILAIDFSDADEGGEEVYIPSTPTGQDNSLDLFEQLWS
jgi:hypothetical protein